MGCCRAEGAREREKDGRRRARHKQDREEKGADVEGRAGKEKIGEM